MGSGGEILTDKMPKGRPLAIDATARSASPTEPAFSARPERVKVLGHPASVIMEKIAKS
jgi:hypothetical protein